MAYINDKQILKVVVHMQQGYEDGYEDGYEAGQKSMVDESKIIEETVIMKDWTIDNIVTLNDVSEIPHKITVTLEPVSEVGDNPYTLTVMGNGEEVATYTIDDPWSYPCPTVEVNSCSPNMVFKTSNSRGIGLTVTYHKSWGIQQGREQEYSVMWDTMQDDGKGQNYYYAFAYGRFTDKNYNPKHPLKCSSGTTSGRYIFYNATGITDTKVEIIPYNDLQYAFNGDSSLVTIRKLTVKESVTYNGAFTGCDKLVDITFDGVIGQDISFRYSSKLSVESIDSIIEHLKDLTGATAQTLTVHTTVYNKIVSSGKDALITAKNWSLAKG